MIEGRPKITDRDGSKSEFPLSEIKDFASPIIL
jgi:hypothetical protein